MTDDNIIEFPYLDDDDETLDLYEDCSEIKQIYQDITVSLMKMCVVDGDSAATALALCCLSILKSQNMTAEQIENFADTIFGNKNY